MFNSSIIKPKKSKLNTANKVTPSKIGSIKTMAEMEEEHGAEEMMPKEKFEISEKPEAYSKPTKANKAKSEDSAKLEAVLMSSKKKGKSSESKMELAPEVKEISERSSKVKSAYDEWIKKKNKLKQLGE